DHRVHPSQVNSQKVGICKKSITCPCVHEHLMSLRLYVKAQSVLTAAAGLAFCVLYQVYDPHLSSSFYISVFLPLSGLDSAGKTQPYPLRRSAASVGWKDDIRLLLQIRHGVPHGHLKACR